MALSGSFTSSWQQRVLDALANNNVVDTALDGLKVGLFTGDPGESGSTANEVTGYGYARQALTFGDATNNSSNHAEVANTNALAFPASGGSWTGISHAGVFRTKSLTRTMVGTTNSGGFSTSGSALSWNKLAIPASHSSTVATLSITGVSTVNPDDSSQTADHHVVLTYSGTDYSYFTADLIGMATNFIRVKTGPLAGVCFDIVADGTNTITLDTFFQMSAEDIVGQKVEVMAKVTLAELSGIVHQDQNTFDSNGYAASGSGFFGGDSSTADKIYLHDSSGGSEVFYAQKTTSLFGDNGWRQLGQSAAVDAGGAVIPPVEIWNHTDENSDDYCLINTKQTADWTLTSQVSTTDEMVARFQFETSGGTTISHTVADGSQLDIAVGDLKLSLN